MASYTVYGQFGEISCQDITDNQYEKTIFTSHKRWIDGQTMGTFLQQVIPSEKRFQVGMIKQAEISVERVIG